MRPEDGAPQLTSALVGVATVQVGPLSCPGRRGSGPGPNRAGPRRVGTVGAARSRLEGLAGIAYLAGIMDHTRMTARVVSLSSPEAGDPRTGGSLEERLATLRDHPGSL